MTPRDFCYWLQGFFEINNPITIDPIELDIIKDHLKLVFRKETPDRSVVPFLGNEREVFDDNYVKEAIGIDVAAERKQMSEELFDLSSPVEEEFFPYKYPDAFSQGIVFDALSPEERENLRLGRPQPKFDLKEYPLYPYPQSNTLADMENPVPVSC